MGLLGSYFHVNHGIFSRSAGEKSSDRSGQKSFHGWCLIAWATRPPGWSLTACAAPRSAAGMTVGEAAGVDLSSRVCSQPALCDRRSVGGKYGRKPFRSLVLFHFACAHRSSSSPPLSTALRRRPMARTTMGKRDTEEDSVDPVHAVLALPLIEPQSCLRTDRGNPSVLEQRSRAPRGSGGGFRRRFPAPTAP